MAAVKTGELLVEQKLISPEQLQQALELQKTYKDQTIGQLLCRLGFISESDLGYVLDNYNKRLKLADILLKNGTLTEQQVVHANKISKQFNINFRKSVLRLSYVDDEPLAQMIAGQYDLPYVNIDKLQIDPSLVSCMSAVYAKKHRIVPISRIGNTLTIAMPEPLLPHETRALEDYIKLKIITVISTENSIIKALKRLYNVEIKRASDVIDELTAVDIPGTIDDLLSSTSESDEPEVDEETRKITEKDSVIVKLVNKIIYDAYMSKASDIHIEPYPGKKNVVVRIRIDGRCSIYQKIPYKYKYAIPSRIKIMAELDISERRKPQDGKIEFKKFGPLDIELRVATMPTAGRLEDVVIRILSSGDPVSFSKLGLTERNSRIFEESIHSPHGLVLVVGPTGSGKTTTLHSSLALINDSERKIWTAEDPVEITQPGLRQVQVNQRIGLTFANALRSFLRLDPDVIMVGEMRDKETASIAIEASLTGHLVFSTLHTNSAPETVTRLLEMGIDPYGFSDSLLCVLAQRLARRLCPECMQPHTPEQEEIDEIIREYGADDFGRSGIVLQEITMNRAVGCKNCDNTGYKGRIGIHELLECTASLKKTVKESPDADSIRDQAKRDGMTTLKQDGIIKVFQGYTDIHEVRRVCIK